jgi:hypothetical protein
MLDRVGQQPGNYRLIRSLGSVSLETKKKKG